MFSLLFFQTTLNVCGRKLTCPPNVTKPSSCTHTLRTTNIPEPFVKTEIEEQLLLFFLWLTENKTTGNSEPTGCQYQANSHIADYFLSAFFFSVFFFSHTHSLKFLSAHLTISFPSACCCVFVLRLIECCCREG